MTKDKIIKLFSDSRWGAIDENGTFVEVDPTDRLHPLADSARWWGGSHDAELLTLAFSLLSQN